MTPNNALERTGGHRGRTVRTLALCARAVRNGGSVRPLNLIVRRNRKPWLIRVAHPGSEWPCQSSNRFGTRWTRANYLVLIAEESHR